MPERTLTFLVELFATGALTRAEFLSHMLIELGRLRPSGDEYVNSGLDLVAAMTHWPRLMPSVAHIVTVENQQLWCWVTEAVSKLPSTALGWNAFSVMTDNPDRFSFERGVERYRLLTSIL